MASSPSLTHRLAARWRITPVSLVAVGAAAQGGTLRRERSRVSRSAGRQPAGRASASEPGADHQPRPGVREGPLQEPERRGSPPGGRAADAARRLEDAGRTRRCARPRTCPPSRRAGAARRRCGRSRGGSPAAKPNCTDLDVVEAAAIASSAAIDRRVVAAEVPDHLVGRPEPVLEAGVDSSSQPPGRSRAGPLASARPRRPRCARAPRRRRPGRIARVSSSPAGRCCGPRRGRPRGSAAGPRAQDARSGSTPR